MESTANISAPTDAELLAANKELAATATDLPGADDLKNLKCPDTTMQANDSSVAVNHSVKAAAMGAMMLPKEDVKQLAKAVDAKIDSKLQADKNRLTVGGAANQVSTWEISGAMAARNQTKGWTASLNWIQRSANQYQIRLSGPLGSGTVLISKQGGMVTLKDGPKTVSSANADQLLRKETGVALPVSNLYYWVRGIPAPGAVQGMKRDGSNRLLVLKQAGYIIEYAQYTSVGKVILPVNIRLVGNGVLIKLIIKRWRV